jgi:hypothetical protein
MHMTVRLNLKAAHDFKVLKNVRALSDTTDVARGAIQGAINPSGLKMVLLQSLM